LSASEACRAGAQNACGSGQAARHAPCILPTRASSRLSRRQGVLFLYPLVVGDDLTRQRSHPCPEASPTALARAVESRRVPPVSVRALSSRSRAQTLGSRNEQAALATHLLSNRKPPKLNRE